jgi:4-hydroxybenzoate polyprenyltransferase
VLDSSPKRPYSESVSSRAAIKGILLHLRLPFFFFLAPIYLFAICSVHVDPFKAVAVFFIFHFLLYPASNGFNSYYDRDEGPIGGLASPPPVTRGLLVAALALDAAALLAALLVGPIAAIAVLCYGTCSKLYSWDRTRLKSRPYASWLMVGLGQGALSFLAMAAASSAEGLRGLGPAAWLCAPLQALFLLGVFPLTQIYQHEEDARRGDLTISRVLGVKGTFVLSGVFLGLAGAGISAWLLAFASTAWALGFLASQAATSFYFLRWARRCYNKPAAADFRSAMAMNALAAGSLNLFLVAFLALR